MKVIGHRGAAALAPENTFSSFELALSLGVDAIETDVQMTKDRALILFHDTALIRTTNGNGILQEKTLKELKRLDAGSWFDKKYRGEQIPQLEHFLERYANITQIDLELKQTRIEKEVIHCIQKYNALGNITITSSNFDSLLQVRKVVPEAKIGLLTTDISDGNLKRIANAGIFQFSPLATLVTPALVEKWKQRGFFIRVWGVKNIAIMQHAINAGVDGMTVDFPDILLKALKR